MIMKNIRIFFSKLSYIEVFLLSFLICLIFYTIEGILGIDRFYHPDSLYYLKGIPNLKFVHLIENPNRILSSGYLLISNFFYNNYYLLIILNFIIYSLTNVLIYKKIFKNNFCYLDNLKLFLLFYLLFLEPYRLHLASHVLKETLIIFFVISIVFLKSNYLKLFFLILIEIFRKNGWIYILIYLTYSNLKIFNQKKIIILVFITILIFILFLVLNGNFYNYILEEISIINGTIKNLFNRDMPTRFYDNVILFRDYGYPVGSILKNILWPVLLLSGFFMFFVSSILFKFLGLIMFLNNFVIYFISKKTFISPGLLIILILISIYTSSYTAMYRYSYVAVYSSIIYFFYNLNFNNEKIK